RSHMQRTAGATNPLPTRSLRLRPFLPLARGRTTERGAGAARLGGGSAAAGRHGPLYGEEVCICTELSYLLPAVEPPRLGPTLDVPVDVLDLPELIEALLAQLAAHAAHLHAAERPGDVIHKRVVDPGRARRNLRVEAAHAARVVR